MHDWKDTQIWKALGASESPERGDVEAFLVTWMKQIQQILAAGGTSPTDFTLHDAEHSFRVAEWMAKIVTEDVLGRLGIYDLALLLLSAYLHDIGMTPEQSRVQRHWRHLVFGPSETDGLTNKQAADFQRWLDDERDGITPPLAKGGQASEGDLRLAAELITYYARYRHNDWSEEWIRKGTLRSDNSSDQVLNLGSYEGWLDDLVRICRSHHEGYDQLVKDSFDPRPAGKHGEVVHIRYIACVLRIADVLDIDPERTPAVLFHHREVAPKSMIYWWKDHDFWIKRDGPALIVHALPSSAVLERAVRDTAELIRVELETCARLSREKPFHHCSFRSLDPLPHRWSFPESLQLQVKPRNDEYVYIDGAFRPDTAKLLELLSGTHLYQEPLVAVRELLQNAFDAVKEEMALTRLRWDNPNDLTRTRILPELHRVELQFKESNDRYWLSCTDTGVGMTRRIIENYLLVSGRSRRHEILDLERKCQSAGFRLGRTGQFGIGVLSYFMLADRVEIYTRRSSAHGDAESLGWRFETEGVGTFGELRADLGGIDGSTIKLRLREEILESRESFIDDLKEYLRATLLFTPCPLLLTEEGSAEPLLHLKTGWQPIEQVFIEDYFQRLQEEALEGSQMPAAKRDELMNDLEEVKNRFQEALGWFSEEGELPDSLGSYRILVPFYDLSGQRSGIFLDFQNNGLPDRTKMILRDSSFSQLLIESDLLASFNGMCLEDFELEDHAFHPYLWQADWSNQIAGKVSISRDDFQMTEKAYQVVSWIKSRAKTLLGEVLSAEASIFSELNARLSPEVPLATAEPWWMFQAGDGQTVWAPAIFPVVDLSSIRPSSRPIARIEWNERPVSLALDVAAVVDTNRRRGFSFERGSLFPDHVGLLLPHWQIVPLYVELTRSLPKAVEWSCAQFPPAWKSICGLIGFHVRPVLNRCHPFAEALEEVDLDWASSSRRSTLASEEVLATRGRAALFIVDLLRSFEFNTRWLTLGTEFRDRLWDKILPPETLVEEMVISMMSLGLLVVRRDKIDRFHPDHPRVRDYLPDPGPEWTLNIIYAD